MRLLLACAVLLSLASCASITEEECVAGNWEEIGFRDGTNGRYQSYLQDHVKACAEVAVTPDPTAWERGRQRGLPVYCVPQKAYDLGRSNRSVNAVCTASQMPALQAANSRGKQYYEITQDINEARRMMSANQARLRKETNPTTRVVLLSENTSLQSEIRLLELRRTAFDSF